MHALTSTLFCKDGKDLAQLYLRRERYLKVMLGELQCKGSTDGITNDSFHYCIQVGSTRAESRQLLSFHRECPFVESITFVESCDTEDVQLSFTVSDAPLIPSLGLATLQSAERLRHRVVSEGPIRISLLELDRKDYRGNDGMELDVKLFAANELWGTVKVRLAASSYEASTSVLRLQLFDFRSYCTATI